MVNLVILLEFLGISLIVIALILLLNGEGAREQKLLIFIMCGSLVQNVGYLLELRAPTVEAAMTALIVENVGSTFVPLFYCWFIYIYCYVTPPRALLRILGAIGFLSLLTVFFDRYGLFYREVQWVADANGFYHVDISYGPLYAFFLFSRIIVPYTLCMLTLIHAVRERSDKQVNRQYFTILGISTLPVIVLIAYVCKLANVYDFTPVTLAISMSMVVIVVWSRRNYDFRHLAAEKVLESMGDGVIALDAHDRLVSYNRAAADIFTCLPAHKLGENIRVVEDFKEEMLSEDAPWSFSINGQHYESHSKHIKDENGKVQGCVILILDMTDIKAYINEIKRVRRQAEKASIAKSEFLANMSHEIRTPMNAIIGMNEIIMEESEDTEICNYARDVQSAAKSLLAIINDILDLSKVEAGKMELVNVNYYLKDMADEIIGMMDMAASQQGLILKYECDETIPCRYKGDDGRIKQILINILSNAIKFTKKGYVRAYITGKPGENENEELLTFHVEDTGCGIREEDLDKIFEDFRQVDSKRNRSAEGTGLGLAIVKNLVELMKGTIKVESTYGKGTIVTITIPQEIVDKQPVSQMPEAPQVERKMTDMFTAPGVKVLIVDDNVINRKVARGFLKNYSFDLDEAESGPEAIELVRATRYDLIFMDHMMPGMDGIEAVEIIRTKCGENGTAPVIVALTANAMEGMRELFLEHGFQDFIAKPLDRRELNRLLLRQVPEKYRQSTDAESESRPLNPETFRIDGVDMNVAMQYYSGDEAGFVDLLDLYCADGKRKTRLLCELVESDILRYQIEVHGLKSASANIGAMDVSNIARAQENAAAQGEREFILEQFPLLMAKYETLLANIEQFLEKYRQDNDVKEKLPGIPIGELRKQTETALEELKHFRSRECAEKVEAILLHELPKEMQERFGQIQEQLRLYEDDNAEELLGQVIGILKEEENQK
ncbi:response regulator [Parablautia intestinalis]|uniref:Circadian input-output histidine kinase CikA n=1 Tax=Parablautia intestinalis TaxID=2320100 RepID=A0A3A9AQE2_9FIRM|nr:ATP-binding protein [Parablautia intestinalis]RKI93264.1 response regulator [Parablautia intestinalis]